MNESFWDAHGVEIGPCAIFDHFDGSGKIDGTDNKLTESMLEVGGVHHPLTFFIENPSFFHKPFILYP